MKILIIGDGSLGKTVALQAEKSGHKIFQTSRKNPQLIHLELKDEQKFTNIPNTEWALIAAGISGYKKCENEPLSRQINVEQTIKLCRTLLRQGTKIIFPSSTAVFDGVAPFPTPETGTCPATEYGRQKAEVENFLRRHPEQTAIIRLTKLLERDTPLISGWLKKLAAGKTITPFHDLSIAPVLFEHAALACCRIMENQGNGIFHCSGPQEISYLEFARKICTHSGFDERLIIPAGCKSFMDYCPVHSGLETSTTEKFIQFRFPEPDQVIKLLLQ